MAQPIFLSAEQLLDLFFAELPDGPYASDRADDPDPEKRSVSSSELRAHATLLAEVYANLSDVWSDKFISSITPGGLAPREKELFPMAQDSSQPFEVRKSNLLAKFRASGGISLPSIRDIVASVLTPKGLAFDILTFNCGATTGHGTWILDESALDVDTILGLIDPLIGARLDMAPLDCALDYAAAGLTLQELLDIQEVAYTYEVRIYGVADGPTLATLDDQLTQFEPARSTHIITNDAPAPSPTPEVFRMGRFADTVVVDQFNFGNFTNPPATFNVWSFGGFT